MEELAVLVLNGDGSKLVGRSSNQPDIQAFLDNIPLYMVKIAGADHKLNVLKNLKIFKFYKCFNLLFFLNLTCDSPLEKSLRPKFNNF